MRVYTEPERTYGSKYMNIHTSENFFRSKAVHIELDKSTATCLCLKSMSLFLAIVDAWGMF